MAGLAVLFVASGIWTAVSLQMWVSDLWRDRAGVDFGTYYSAALLGMARGWRALYEGNLYATWEHAVIGHSDKYVNLPLAAWAALPFTVLPFRVADVVWLLLLAGAFVWSWRTATTGPRWERVLLLLAALASYPVHLAIDLGQLALLVGALLVLHWWLLRAGHPVMAGVVLGLAFLKPQDVLLLPLVLLLSRSWKAAAACGITVAVLAVAVAVAIGFDGLHALQSTLSSGPPTCRYCSRQTLGANLPGWAPQLPVRAAIVLVALVPAMVAGARRYERALTAGVLGSLLVTPYLNHGDLTLLFVCAWLVLNAGASSLTRLALLVTYPFVAFENLTGPIPLLVAELAWLVALAWGGLSILDALPARLSRMTRHQLSS